MPQVAVIIPTYNRAAWVAEAIESILSQTMGDLEIVVTDDGSTDETPDVVRRFGRPVRYLWQPNAGQGAARNRGIRETNAEFVSFLDSDDVWLPDKLASDLEALKAHPRAALVSSNVEYISATGTHVAFRNERPPSGPVLVELAMHNFVTTSTVTLRRQEFLEVGGFSEDRDMRGSEDWEAWMRLAVAHELVFCPRVTARIRVHRDRAMSNADGMRRAMLAALTAVEQNPYFCRQLGRRRTGIRASMYHHIAMNYYGTDQEQAGRDWLVRAFLTDWRIAAQQQFLGACLRASLGRDKVLRLKSALTRTRAR